MKHRVLFEVEMSKEMYSFYKSLLDMPESEPTLLHAAIVDAGLQKLGAEILKDNKTVVESLRILQEVLRKV